MEQIVYAGRIKDRKTLLESSSGGAFTAISDWFLKNGYPVISSVYNYETNQQEFQILKNASDRDHARGSKYVQSKPGEIYKLTYNWCKENPEKELLFVGTGCQADGFRIYSELKGIRNQVTVVDIICHGVPSPKIWREYAMSLGKISYLTFKDKRNGWNNPMAVAIVDGQEKSLNKYIKVFYDHCNLRPSCYVCPFATTVRKTDITIGDFWGIENKMTEFYDPDGNSLFLIHTEKGRWLFKNIKINLDYREINVKDCLQPNLIKPTSAPIYRTKFWRDYKKHGAVYIVNKYGNANYHMGILNKVKSLLKRIRVTSPDDCLINQCREIDPGKVK